MSAYVLSTAAQACKSQHQLQLGSKPITKERLKKKLAEVAEADGEDEDGKDTNIEDEGE